MTEHFCISSSYVLHFDGFKVMGMFPQALEIIFLKCKGKRLMKK
jgi:hypothetical protein